MDQPLGVSPEDEGLVLRIRSGDREAEEELVRRFQPGLLAIACTRVGRTHASDLVQETLASALVNLRRGDFQGRGSLAAYLATILRRAAQRAVSVLARTVPSDLEGFATDGFDPLAAAERAQARERLREALGQLSSIHREIVLQYYFEGRTIAEIVREMSIPRGTVLSRLHHARKKIATRMNRLRLRGH